MTGDGTFEYTWNGENRLIQVEPETAASGDLRLTFTYDFMGCRVQKVVETYDGSSWSTNAVTKFVWDGWLLIAELDGTDSDTLTRTCTWGLDLRGTFRGAGGTRVSVRGLTVFRAGARRERIAEGGPTPLGQRGERRAGCRA